MSITSKPVKQNETPIAQSNYNSKYIIALILTLIMSISFNLYLYCLHLKVGQQVARLSKAYSLNPNIQEHQVGLKNKIQILQKQGQQIKCKYMELQQMMQEIQFKLDPPKTIKLEQNQFKSFQPQKNNSNHQQFQNYSHTQQQHNQQQSQNNLNFYYRMVVDKINNIKQQASNKSQQIYEQFQIQSYGSYISSTLGQNYQFMKKKASQAQAYIFQKSEPAE